MGFNNEFTVRYCTPKGRWINLPVTGLPDNEELRAMLTDPDHRAPWAQAFLDQTYAEYRQADNRRRTDVSADAVGDAGADYFEAAGDSVEDQIASNAVVVSLLSGLTGSQREFVELHVLGGYTYPEIAQAKNTSADAVRKSVARAKAQLRKVLGDDPSGFTSADA